jgi:hypothetical protein
VKRAALKAASKKPESDLKVCMHEQTPGERV